MKHLRPINKKAQRIDEAVAQIEAVTAPDADLEEDVIALQQ